MRRIADRTVPRYYGLFIAILAVVLFQTSGMWYFPISDENAPGFGEFVGGRINYNLMLLLLAGSLAMFHRHALAALLRYKLLTLTIVLQFLSIVVSVEPKESLLFSIRMLLFIPFFAVAAMMVVPKHWIRLLACFFGIGTVVNLAYSVAFPQLGVMSGIHDGAFRGLFSHKNQYGYFCAYAVVFFVLLATQPGRFLARVTSLALAGMAFIAVILAKSGGSLVCALAGLAASAVILFSPKVPTANKTILLSIVAFIVLVCLPFINEITAFGLGLLGRDPTLTNRADIWGLYMHEYARSPILGLGANAFGMNEDIKFRIQSLLGSSQSLSPHNGYLAILLQTGALGLAVYILIAGRIVIGGIRQSLTGGSGFEKILLIFTIMHLVRGSVETGGSVQLTFYFGLFVAAYVGLSKRHRQQERVPLLPEPYQNQ